MERRSYLRPFLALERRTQGLLGLWAFFVLLVAFGIHGSSTGITAVWWMPEKPYTGYLLWDPPPPPDIGKAEDDLRRNLLMANARWIRWDELMVSTPLALSQLSHRPRFPVVNTNVGVGQNMLILQQVPVWHVATFARPSTWGYFFLGAQRGLAWHWWFQIFACFTALFLLFEIVLKGNRKLAAFGAFWYCGSAYVVCWSLWPAYITFFIALGCLSAYHLFRAEKTSTLILCAVLLGLSLSGFFMFLYPPWQVSLGYLFLLLFVGLLLRDKLYLSFKSLWLYRVVALLGAAALAATLIGAYLSTCLPDMKIMTATVYPGQRVSLGGDFSFALLFEGMYNWLTLYRYPSELNNQTETASFYYLFPAVFLGLLLSKRLRSEMSVVGWMVVCYLVGMLIFMFVGLPEAVAKITILSYVPPYRADAAIGLASIVLCMLTLNDAGKVAREGLSRWQRLMPWIVGGLLALLFIWHGLAIRRLTNGFFAVTIIVLVSLLVGLLSYLLLSGRRRAFCAFLGVGVVITTGGFNPLSTSLDHLYDSELAQVITRLNAPSADFEPRPLWVCYGGRSPGMLVTTLGGKSLSGMHWPPQLSLWRRVDALGRYENEYNRFAMVNLEYGNADQGVVFKSQALDALTVTISPHAPILKQLGARYVLALHEAQNSINTDGLKQVYASSGGYFTIYEIQP